ncbi:MAG: hypothetical protein VZR24_16095 [Butyrivibrio hungatei]|nr:hypothetical protein [Butyrivibrio hungatei]
MEPKLTLNSIKNENIYNLYEDKIVVQNGTMNKELCLPIEYAGQSNYVCFSDIYYIQNKLYAILITNGFYDMRVEIDEDNITFTGSPIPTY